MVTIHELQVHLICQGHNTPINLSFIPPCPQSLLTPDFYFLRLPLLPSLFGLCLNHSFIQRIRLAPGSTGHCIRYHNDPSPTLGKEQREDSPPVLSGWPQESGVEFLSSGDFRERSMRRGTEHGCPAALQTQDFQVKLERPCPLTSLFCPQLTGCPSYPFPLKIVQSLWPPYTPYTEEASDAKKWKGKCGHDKQGMRRHWTTSKSNAAENTVCSERA